MNYKDKVKKHFGIDDYETLVRGDIVRMERKIVSHRDPGIGLGFKGNKYPQDVVDRYNRIKIGDIGKVIYSAESWVGVEFYHLPNELFYLSPAAFKKVKVFVIDEDLLGLNKRIIHDFIAERSPEVSSEIRKAQELLDLLSKEENK